MKRKRALSKLWITNVPEELFGQVVVLTLLQQFKTLVLGPFFRCMHVCACCLVLGQLQTTELLVKGIILLFYHIVSSPTLSNISSFKVIGNYLKVMKLGVGWFYFLQTYSYQNVLLLFCSHGFKHNYMFWILSLYHELDRLRRTSLQPFIMRHILQQRKPTIFVHVHIMFLCFCCFIFVTLVDAFHIINNFTTLNECSLQQS